MTPGHLTVALGPLPVDSFSVVALAATWVLVALGLHLTFGMLGVVNLAHGELLLVGAYTVVLAHSATGSVVFGVLLAGPVTATVGWVMDRLLLRRFENRLIDTLLATFGVALVLRQGIQLLAGPNLRSVPDPIGRSLLVGSLIVPGWRLVVLIATITLAGALWMRLTWSASGALWRAATGDPKLATTLAVDVPRIRTRIFVTGAGLSGLAGALLAPLSSVSPQFGTRFLVPAFVVVILGGAGSIGGLVVVGTLLGASLGVLQFFIDPIAAQLSVLLIAVVLLRSARRGAPWGPLGEPTR